MHDPQHDDSQQNSKEFYTQHRNLMFHWDIILCQVSFMLTFTIEPIILNFFMLTVVCARRHICFAVYYA